MIEHKITISEMRALHRERILNIARALRESPCKKTLTMNTVILDCGTPGCAFGHYVCRPDLQSAFVSEERSGEFHVVDAQTGKSVSYYGRTVQEHFDFTAEEISELFDAHGCGGARTAADAAQYIEAFVARKYA
jgi:hypothetical protein